MTPLYVTNDGDPGDGRTGWPLDLTGNALAELQAELAELADWADTALTDHDSDRHDIAAHLTSALAALSNGAPVPASRF